MTIEPEDFMTEEFMKETKEALKEAGFEGETDDFVIETIVEMIMEVRKQNDLE